MSLLTSFNLSSAGMSVQKDRLNVAAENLANVSTTRTPEGGPYRKKSLMIGSIPVGMQESFEAYLKKADVKAPQVSSVQKSGEDFISMYDPQNPDADTKGFVKMPNISTTQEMVNMMAASSAYEANMSVFSEAKTMFMRTLDMGSV
ncbi:MAG: flagellar basal body rod protein FlgC [Deltaproteobacteria bacterium]|nr:flagellar basal body rod protein FlgC [Deltaproteobacteria bacterium]